MPREYISIGPSPCNEDCVQLGSDNYNRRAREECRRFAAAIRATLGEEPDGAELSVEGFPHDFGTYFETVCLYDIGNEEAEAYAFRCESDAPSEWPEGFRTAEEFQARANAKA